MRHFTGICTAAFIGAGLYFGVAGGFQAEPAKEKAKKPPEKITPRLNVADPTKDILEGLDKVDRIAEELHSDCKRWCELMLDHMDPAVRVKAAKTLAQIGVHPIHTSDATFALQKRLKFEGNVDVRVAILQTLHAYRPHAKDMIPLFLEYMKDKNPKVRRQALSNIGGYWPEKKELISVFVDALDDPDTGQDEKHPGLGCVSDIAMVCLYRHKSHAIEASPKLAAIVKSKKWTADYQLFALNTLASIAPDDPLPLDMGRAWLKKTDSDKHIMDAVGVLANIGPHAKGALPELMTVAKTKAGIPHRLTFIKIFRSIGPDAKEAIPILEDYQTMDDDFAVRRDAREAIVVIRGKM